VSQRFYPNPELFKSELETGHLFEEKVQDRLLELGFNVQLGNEQERLQQVGLHQHANYTNPFLQERDITVKSRTGRVLLEVKSRNVSFTGVDDFPFNPPFVMAKGRWDAVRVKPAAVLMISQVTDCIIALNSKTADSWRVLPGPYEPARKIREDKLTADISLWSDFDTFVEQLSKVCPRNPLTRPGRVVRDPMVALDTDKAQFFKGDWRNARG
jgi:hypothetical protein